MITITTPYSITNTSSGVVRADQMKVHCQKLAPYYMIENFSGATVALYKPAIPQLIEVLQRIHNGESV